MPATKTSQRALEEQERRRQFQATIPQCFCPRCTTLTYASDSECFDCGLPRPGAGWPPLDECPDSWVGETIEDRYLVTKPIAQGHGSRIYRADSRIIPRSFGIKIMDVTGGPSLDQEGLRRRLRREIEVLSSLRNPHIVSFYDIVELPADRIAFVMDLIDGVALDDGHRPLESAVVVEGDVAPGGQGHVQRAVLRGGLAENLLALAVVVDAVALVSEQFLPDAHRQVVFAGGKAIGARGGRPPVPKYRVRRLTFAIR